VLLLRLAAQAASAETASSGMQKKKNIKWRFTAVHGSTS
jgi:hypothetical protein